jgi:Enoyl-CoA hydratase/isomerase
MADILKSIDPVEAERFSPLGSSPLIVLDLADRGAESRARCLSSSTRAIIIGVDFAGSSPALDPQSFDCLISAAPGAPQPWVAVAPAFIKDRAAGIAAAIADAPHAASALCAVLRIGELQPFDNALMLESLAYSMLLGGQEFGRWRAAHPPPIAQPTDQPYVSVERSEDQVTLTLSRPDTRNAMSAGMRDALFDALAAILVDPTEPKLLLKARGACFSTGGDLAEFGTARDLAQAHHIRTLRSCATLLHDLGDRAEVLLHGACIGSGIEIPAAAARRCAKKGTFVQLPELSMGLIPGAGGTVTLSRAIGRHRTCYMALTGQRIPAPIASAWGLLHGIESET